MMLNQTSAEAQYTAAFVDNYLDYVENLPEDLQRRLTRMRELDVSYRACIREVENNLALCVSSADGDANPQHANKRARAFNKIQQALITSQELGDEKLQVVQQLLDQIEIKSRELDGDYRKLISCIDYGTNGTVKDEQPSSETAALKESNSATSLSTAPVPQTNQNSIQTPTTPQNHDREREKNDKDKTVERASKRARRTRTETQSGDSGGRDNERELVVEPPVVQRSTTSNNTSNTGATHKKGYTGTGKKKKRKSRQVAQSQREETPPIEDPDPIDPDEPTYCLCDQISFGEMILCDNDLCPIEWFHFSCVSLTTKPKGKWFCPKCRGDRPNIMKPKGQFLKELERYNKEKEEKA